MPLKSTFAFTSGCFCAALILLWVGTFFTSFSHRFAWGQNPRNSIDLCVCDDGIVVGCRADDPFDTEPSERGDRHSLNAHGNDPHFFIMGAGYFHMPSYSVIIVPLWMLIAPTLITPALAVWRNGRKQRRLAASLCLQCRYDLRAHSAGSRCPECGLLIEEKVAPSFPVQMQLA